MRLDDLIADPASDEEAEDAVLVGERDEDGEDDEVDDALGILAVVHSADAGNEAEEGGQAGVGTRWGLPTGRRACSPLPGCVGGGAGLMRVAIGRSCSGSRGTG